MTGFLIRSRWLFPALLAWAWIGTALGFAAGSRILHPFLCLTPAYLAMLVLLRHGLRKRAVAVMLVWALGLGMAGTTFSTLFPERAGTVTFNGAEYREEMYKWIRTGEGPEGDVALFLPLHARHIVVFVLLSLGTVSLLSMVFGTILMNYMSFYVGSLFSQTESLGIILLFGWPIWSVIRILSYVTLGVVLAEPILARLFPYRWEWRDLSPYLIAAGSGLILDALLKAGLASTWRTWLLSAIGAS